MIDKVLSVYTLEKCHAFIRDRTRSIRQDFTLQNIRDITAVQVHERIARFHILCLHEMCGMDESKFSEQQETEQLRKGFKKENKKKNKGLVTNTLYDSIVKFNGVL